MASFYYMLPAAPGTDAEHLERYGLSGRVPRNIVARGCSVVVGANGLPTTTGTEHTECSLFCVGATPRFAPDRQIWTRIDCEGPQAWWIGFDKDSPPGPDDLLRPEAVPGYRVFLGDGRWWSVPIARQFPEGTGLPEIIRMGTGNRLVTSIQPAYLNLFNRCAALAGQYYAQPDSGFEGVRIPWEECWSLALDGLAVNYRIGAAEANALALFTRATLQMVVSALIDAPSCDEEHARKHQATQEADGAPEDEADPTSPGT